MWDTNLSNAIYSEVIDGGLTIEPTLFNNSLLVIVQNSKFSIKDFSSGDLVSETIGRTKFAKWSPYREEYLATGEENTIKIWDTRRLSTPVHTCGFSNNNNPRKRAKYTNSVNMYGELFMSQSVNQVKKFEDNVVAADFSKDGRFLFVQTTKEIFKVDLCCSDIDPSIFASGIYNESSPILKRIDDGIISAMQTNAIIYNNSGDTKQIINFHQELAGITGINQGDYFYILGLQGDLQRYSSSI